MCSHERHVDVLDVSVVMETESIAPVGRLRSSSEMVSADVPKYGFVSRVLIRDAGTIHVVKVRDIEWIDACGNYIEIHAKGKTFLHRETLGGIASRLPSRQFVKMHRSLIVNAGRVREVRTLSRGQYSLVMGTGVELPINRPLHEIHNLIMEACSEAWARD